MASLDSLPADQRAVLELVLQRGRSYDEIAQMLSIDRAGVRQRALAALDALGPQTKVDTARRALITDYLLGQLPARIANETRASLARVPTERAWARVVSSELGALARDPLPEIPAPEAAGAGTESAAAGARGAAESAGAASEPARAGSEPAGAGAGAATSARAGSAAEAPSAAAAAAGDEPSQRPGRPGRQGRAGRTGRSPRPSSRLGGAVLLGLSAAVVVVVVLVLLLTGGSSKKHTSSTAAERTTPTTTTSTTPVRPLAQVNLFPTASGSQAKGIALILTVGNALGVQIFATGVPANSHNAYAVWLYNSASSSQLVGFVSPDVGSTGQLQTQGKLPANASSYKQILVTLETQPHPKSPGQIVLSGTLKIPAH